MISANFYWQKKRKFEESTRSVNLRCFPSRWILQILINQRRFDERLERKETRKIEAILRSCQRPNINLVVDAFNSSTCVNCLLARGSTEARITPEITVADRSDRFKTELTTCSYVGLAEIMKCTDDEMGERTPVCACVRAACNAARLRLYNARPRESETIESSTVKQARVPRHIVNMKLCLSVLLVALVATLLHSIGKKAAIQLSNRFA